MQFKTRLVEELIGKTIDELMEGKTREEQDAHVPVQFEDGKRPRCVLCTMTGTKIIRTSYKCGLCGIPLCCFGFTHGERDCFGEAHKSEVEYQRVLKKHLAMKNLDTRKK